MTPVMQRPLITAAIVALAVGLVAFGAGAIRDANPSTHAQGSATPTPTASPTASPSSSPNPVASPTTTASSTPACTDAMLGPGLTRAAEPKLAADCDTLLGLRYRLSRPDTLNWGDATAALTAGDGWDSVTVSGTPKRVTALTLAPYAFKDALAELAKLDALVDLDLDVYTTPTTLTTPTTPATSATDTTPTTGTTMLRGSASACTATTLGGSRAANPQLTTDCDTLLKIKSTLAGAATTLDGDADGWDATRALTSWIGITVDGTPKRVFALDLRDTRLNGTIPTQIGKLTGLTRLDLSGTWDSEEKNQMTGSIPTHIGKLIALKELNLSGNQLTGSIPTQIGNLITLKELNLDGNLLSGGIPTQVGKLTTLTRLNLSGNQLTESIPTQIRKMTALTNLLLRSNRLSGSIPTQIGKMTNLEVFSIYRNRLTGSIPTQIGNLARLRNLNLWGNTLTGSIPTQLGGLTALTKLTLEHNRLTGYIPTQLGNLTALQDLRMHGQYIEASLYGSIPPQLGNLVNLTRLGLGGNAFTGCVPYALSRIGGYPTNLPACSSPTPTGAPVPSPTADPEN